MSRKQALQAVRDLPREKDFLWGGVDEDERPATNEELLESLEAQRRKRGRPSGSGNKEQVAIRIDRDVLAAFRAGGPGWQTCMNQALRKWLCTHSKP
ncbi:hypothetical protein TVNIR_0004 [Thioalkalivibrio nitratireducens DSM 14787]|uniref:BrnA antitoxin of type II toxin-antitoxin system n=2 Tax=Thioalkalivibrio nitratireducens TaxID=186931 RepID=L0DQI7_THIND|nr:hypothetical protein TVNIR_0004 [Thioalkalivibrio nitratireducens DSM 14787]